MGFDHRSFQPQASTPAPGLATSLDAVKRMRLEMGTTPVELAAEHVEDARPELLEAMKCLDSSEDRALHMRLGKFLIELDDFRAVLAERSTS